MIKKKYTIILSVLAFFQSAFLLGIPFLSKYVVNEAIKISKMPIKDYDNLIKYIAILISCATMGIIIKLIYNVLYNHFQLRFEEDMKNKLYASIVNKDLDILSKYHIGELDALFHKDIDNVSNAYLESIPNIVRQGSRCLIAMIMLAIIDTSRWFIIGIIVLGLLSIIMTRVYSHYVKPHHKKVLEADSISSSFVVETLNAGGLIQSYKAAGRAYDYYENLNKNATKAKRGRNRIVVGANSLVFAVTNFMYVACLCIGGYLISDNVLTYGALVALVQLLNSIEYPLLSLSSYLNRYNLGAVSKKRIEEMLALEEACDEEPLEDFDSIVLDDISYSYEDLDVVKNMSYEIKKGDIVRISGRSGIGKTTIFMLILGFKRPLSGNVWFRYNGENILASAKTRGLISYVSQENILFSGSILDNIKILTNVTDENKIKSALEEVNLYSEIAQMKCGLNTVLRDKGDGLSKGQIQRLLIAIALLYDKPIMMLDEFSSALDKENEALIIKNLEKKNKTIIFITHRDSEIRNERKLELGE